MRLIARVLERAVSAGRLRIEDADGRTWQFGPGGGPEATVRITDPGLERKLLWNPVLAFGEAYMDGGVELLDGRLIDVIMMVDQASEPEFVGWVPTLFKRLRTALRSLGALNFVGLARRNVAHHYDLSSELFDLFLDSDRQYSCAYFPTADTDLETAQLAKKRHLAAKLYLQPGQRVLDIGCGWGGLGLYLAEQMGARVTGLTLSEEQYSYANQRAAATGLADWAGFRLRDYRQENAGFDRIVSVGMFEHVGLAHYPAFFNSISRLLRDDGVAVLHSIGHTGPPEPTNPWISKYIFPGGYIPSLSEVLPQVERAGLITTDVEILRRHYAETLKAWRENFEARRERAKTLYDERFCRMWEFYLAIAEAGFRRYDMIVFQLQMTKRGGVLPITRDYMLETERDLAKRDRNPDPLPTQAAAE